MSVSLQFATDRESVAEGSSSDHPTGRGNDPAPLPSGGFWDGKRGRNAGTGLAASPTTIVAKGPALLWDAAKIVRIKGI